MALFEALQSIIISNERTEIHERICDSFDRMSEMSVGDVQHAKHYSMAGKWNEACDKYMESGIVASHSFNFVDAVACYEEAKKCLVQSARPSLK